MVDSERIAAALGIVSLSGLFAYFYVPPGALSVGALTFFGVSGGSVRFFGVLPLEHEFFGVGLLAMVFVKWDEIMGASTAVKAFLVALPVVLIVTDLQSILGLFGAQISWIANPLGSAVSAAVGAIYGVLLFVVLDVY